MAEVRLQFDMGKVEIGMDQAAPCGLLVSELISNCFKHGFPDDCSGNIRIELKAVNGDGLWRLCVSDTGVGLPLDFEAKQQSSLGLQLVGDLCKQIRGTLQVGLTPGAASGASFAVTFEVDVPAALVFKV